MNSLGLKRWQIWGDQFANPKREAHIWRPVSSGWITVPYIVHLFQCNFHLLFRADRTFEWKHCSNLLSDEKLYQNLRGLQFDMALLDAFPYSRCFVVLLYRYTWQIDNFLNFFSASEKKKRKNDVVAHWTDLGFPTSPQQHSTNPGCCGIQPCRHLCPTTWCLQCKQKRILRYWNRSAHCTGVGCLFRGYFPAFWINCKPHQSVDERREDPAPSRRFV